MKFDSEGLWKHAENIAYFANAAFEAMKAKKASESNVNAFIKSMNLIKVDCTKVRFINVCTVICDHVEFKSSSFKDAMKYALALPEKGENINDNMTFSYFVSLVNFHIACYKSDWEKGNNK